MTARNLFVSLILWATAGQADDVSVAVTADFAATARTIAGAFEQATGHSVTMTAGATGGLAKQIEAGAAFDILLAGDARHPAVLQDAGLVVETKTYAFGVLTLVSQVPLQPDLLTTVIAGRTVALADPIASPYGKAATLAMERLALDTAAFQPLVVADVTQAGVLFQTRRAEVAFVAASMTPSLDPPFSVALDAQIPPFRQDAAFLRSGQGSAAAAAFWDWMSSDAARSVIRAAGYRLTAG